jgi:4-alpha-glucanotransferase
MALVRGSGVLLHPTSLPGPHGSGDLGPDALRFVDWLRDAGQRYWQVLPLTPVGYGSSPYSSLSAFASNPMLVNLHSLAEKGWLARAEVPDHTSMPARTLDFGASNGLRTALLRKASARFLAVAAPADRHAFESYCAREAAWLEDYALFMALHDAHGGREWTTWEEGLRTRDPAALAEARARLAGEVAYHRFGQWAFHQQWTALHDHARARGVQLVGDMPIFVAHHSADVWAHPELFHLDAAGVPYVVAGVPPDYFSETGQRWGNPLYRWDVMAKDGYRWWVARMRALLSLVDVARIDHFRGFEAFWEIPAGEKTAVNGRWVKAPGLELFRALSAALGELPIIAEDLGIITPEVEALRDACGFPGMKVLQFAFGGDAENPFLPHNHVPNAVVYTGTHDNDTTRGWFAGVSEDERGRVRRYLSTSGDEIHWDLLRAAAMSVAKVALFPLQDVLGLGGEGRMNVPGVAAGNWAWRFAWDDVPHGAAGRLAELARTYGRR